MSERSRNRNGDASPWKVIRAARETRRRAELIVADTVEIRETARLIRADLLLNRRPRDAAVVFEFTCSKCGPFMDVGFGNSARRKTLRCPECSGPVTEDALYDETGRRLPGRRQADH